MVPPFTRPPLVSLPCLSLFLKQWRSSLWFLSSQLEIGFHLFLPCIFHSLSHLVSRGGEDIVRMQCFLGGDTLSKLCSHLKFRLWVALCRIFACENFVPENLGCLNWLRTRPPPRHSPPITLIFLPGCRSWVLFSPSPPIRWVAWEGGPLQNNFCSGTSPVRRRGGANFFCKYRIRSRRPTLTWSHWGYWIRSSCSTFLSSTCGLVKFPFVS